MDIERNLVAPAEPAPRRSRTPADLEIDPDLTPIRGMSFRDALARVEAHRSKVRIALAVALIVRLVFELHLVSLIIESPRSSAPLLATVPAIGLVLLAYLIVLWFLATRTRDRFGFGMSLGIGVLVTTYQLAMAATIRPFSIMTVWPMGVIALAHLALAYTAFRTASAFPPHDGKRPWIVGFITALVFVSISWVAPAVTDLLRH